MNNSMKNLNLMLENYRLYINSANTNNINPEIKNKIENSDKSVIVKEAQTPDILVKRESNPFFDQNQSFFVNKTISKEDLPIKVIVKDYNPNYFLIKAFPEQTNPPLNISKHSFEIIPQNNSKHLNYEFYYQETFRNIDLELELNYEMLNQNKKWLIFSTYDEKTYGPLGTADAYILIKTNNKNISPFSSHFYIVDSDNECFLSTDFAFSILTEEILITVEENERFHYFHRNKKLSFFNRPLRQLVVEKNKNKFDLNRTIDDYWSINLCNSKIKSDLS
jgi:hypothetical protein